MEWQGPFGSCHFFVFRSRVSPAWGTDFPSNSSLLLQEKLIFAILDSGEYRGMGLSVLPSGIRDVPGVISG